MSRNQEVLLNSYSRSLFSIDSSVAVIHCGKLVCGRRCNWKDAPAVGIIFPTFCMIQSWKMVGLVMIMRFLRKADGRASCVVEFYPPP